MSSAATGVLDDSAFSGGPAEARRLYPLLNAGMTAAGRALPGPAVRIDSNARDLFPIHRFIRAQDKFEGFFGNASPVALALVVEDGGTIFEPDTLAKLKRITNALDGRGFDSQTRARLKMRRELEDAGWEDIDALRAELDRHFPPYPVNHDQTRSLVHRTTRVVSVEPDGASRFDALVEALPTTREGALALRDRVYEDAPEVLGRLLTADGRTALSQRRTGTRRGRPDRRLPGNRAHERG